MRPDVTSAEAAINLTSIVSVAVTCCVNVIVPEVVIAAPFEPDAKKPVDETSPPSTMSSPSAKSMSTVGDEPLTAASTSAPANNTIVLAGISSS